MNGQLSLDWTSAMSDASKKGSTRSRGFSQAGTTTPEYIDIGSCKGARPIVKLTVGSGKSQCGRCGLAFTSVSGFDKHQRLTKDGSIICLNSETVGLIERDGWWSFPPDPRFAATT